MPSVIVAGHRVSRSTLRTKYKFQWLQQCSVSICNCFTDLVHRANGFTESSRCSHTPSVRGTDGSNAVPCVLPNADLARKEHRGRLLTLSPHILLSANGARRWRFLASPSSGNVRERNGDCAVGGLSTSVGIRMQTGSDALTICRDGRDNRRLWCALDGILFILDDLSQPAVLHSLPPLEHIYDICAHTTVMIPCPH
jgi:hypothetical protein